MHDDEAERLGRLEREMSILREELARLGEAIGAREKPAETVERPPAPADAIPTVTSRPSTPDPIASAFRREIVLPPMEPVPREDSEPRRSIEEMVGRYGTIAVATLTVLIGVGIFLNWAIEHALLGPTVRVVLGYMIALGMAAVGARLRIRGTREFGNILLAIALGIVHLVSWSAGPLLHVIPSPAALAIGVLASAILSEFALRHDEETLAALGFGGATIAPFLLSDPGGNRIALAVYGLAIVALASAALGDRRWIVARRVTMASLIIYTLTVGAGSPSDSPPEWISSRLWVLFPLVELVALIPAARATQRRALIRTASLGLILGGVLRAVQGFPDLWAWGLSIFGTIIAVGFLDLTRPGAIESEAPSPSGDDSAWVEGAVFDAFVLPLFLFISSVVSTSSMVSFQSSATAVLWTIGTLWLSYRSRGAPEANYYASASALIALWIVPAAWLYHELPLVAGSVGVGVALMLVARRMSSLPFVFGALASLAMASFWALLKITVREPFRYVPFGTIATAGCAVAVIGWIVATRLTRSREFLPELAVAARNLLRVALMTAAAVTAFLWGVGELQGAWNETASTSLLILYYAATGTFMIWLGRTRAVKPLRVLGLAVSLWAAWKSLKEVFFLPNVAVRIGLFFAVSAFLIAVGYWYRHNADDEVFSDGANRGGTGIDPA